MSIARKILLFCGLIFCYQNITAQSDFKKCFSLSSDEPNQAFHAIQHNDHFYISGNQFDTERGSWNTFVGKFDDKAEFKTLVYFDGNPIQDSRLNNHTFQNEDSYYFITTVLDTTRILRYDFDKDSLFIDKIFNRRAFDMNVTTYLLNEEKEMTCYGGSTIESIRNSIVVVMDKNDTLVYESTVSDSENRIYNMRFNSKNQIVAVEGVYRNDTIGVAVLILDKELNLLNTKRDSFFRYDIRNGMLIDHNDNILVTAVKTTPNNGSPERREGILKFDPEGNYQWWKAIGNNKNNFWNQGIWHSLVETHEQDGYIVVGAEAYDTMNQDTAFSQATVARISSEGDSIWMKRFSFREYNPVLLEVFTDVIQTNDGGYFLTGGTTFPDGNSSPETPWIKSLLVKLNGDGEVDTTGVNVVQIDKEEDLNVFPNPVLDYIYLEQKTNEPLDVKIMSSNGILVDNFQTSGIENITAISTQNYSNGHFVLIASDKKGNVYRKKMILVR